MILEQLLYIASKFKLNCINLFSFNRNFSDGTGRTGTFIVIDIILNEIANGKNEINIETTLKCIRDQRPGMIKTKVCIQETQCFSIKH